MSGLALAAPPENAGEAAWTLYVEGRAVAAREAMVRHLDDPRLEPGERVASAETLLDICIEAQMADCVRTYSLKHADWIKPLVPLANNEQKRDLARRAGYYLDYAVALTGTPEARSEVLQRPMWRSESTVNAGLYLRRQALAVEILVADDRYADAGRSLDKTLSLIATLKNPEADRLTVARSLAGALFMLAAIGESERAYGIYKATGAQIARALPPRTLEAVKFRLVEAELLQSVGDLKGARAALDQAVGALGATELEAPVKTLWFSNVLTSRAAICLAAGELDCARSAIESHPYAALAAKADRAPETYGEATYLTVRTLVGAASGAPDKAAANALARARPDGLGPAAAARMALYQALGRAFAGPPGPQSRAALAEAGRRLVEAVERRPGGGFGNWYKPGAAERMVIALALAAADPKTADGAALVFSLAQLDLRAGPAFDADAQTLLGQTKDPLQRRAVHQALRLRARRDRLERIALQRVAARLAAQRADAGALIHDPLQRLAFANFAHGMDAAQTSLADAGIRATGANLIALARFQAVLAPGEAALSVAPTLGGLAYVCVRREGLSLVSAPADLKRAGIDTRLLQASLTAGHAQSEALDSQFPAEAAVRLYDLLIRPFEPCLAGADHILWLPGVAYAKVPLAALLPAAPPRLAQGSGYDLAKADWLAKRVAVSYAGSASVILAARAGGTRPAPSFDFLGLGDPLLTGTSATGEARRGVVLRGLRDGSGVSDLQPLPETRAELMQSSAGLKSVRLLTGEAATERRFRGELVGAYSFLSFATHGLLRDDLQGLSEPALVLTPVSAGDERDDGLLTASEIADLDLAGRFVALSACNTANFDLSQMASDLPALASAFSVAGAPSILGTLWSVDSLSSKAVVAATFAALRRTAGAGSAIALAEAQRAFLASPPGRAYLHPRFWAPFVILGDGGQSVEPVASASRPKLMSVERLTASGSGGEVMAVTRLSGKPASRFIGDPDASGRHPSGVAVAGDKGWRRESAQIGAGRVLAPLQGALIAGGYATGADGRLAPTLEAYGGSGKALARWVGEAATPGLDGLVKGVAVAGPNRLLFGVAARDLKPGGKTAPRLQIYETGLGLTPRKLFEIELEPGVGGVDEVVLVARGEAVLVSYTERFRADLTGFAEDEFDVGMCGTRPTTWLEMRETATGRKLASRRLEGLVITAATSGAAPVLAGSAQAACGPPRAMTAAVDEALDLKFLYVDVSPGASEVRGAFLLPDGGLFVSAHKQPLTDLRMGGGARQAAAGDALSSGMLLRLDGESASEPVMLDSGFDVFLGGVDASDPRDVLVAGSVGGDAAILHLKMPGQE